MSQQLSDEELAKRLQSEEFNGAARPAPSRSNTQGARGASLPPQEQPPANRFALTTGQTAAVKLHHVATNRQIGEVVLVHYVEGNVLAFELNSLRGHYLTVKNNAALDYAPGLDDASKFFVEAVAGGNVIFLSCKKFVNGINRLGAINWYLGLTPGGQLYANGGKDQNSQWALVAAATPVAPPTQTSSDIGGTIASPLHPPLGQGVSAIANGNAAAAPNAFPGLEAGREELQRFFQSPQGEQFLNQPNYAHAKTLAQRGQLAQILHRPDWPLLSANYVDPTTQPVVLNEALAARCASFSTYKKFFEEGYTVLNRVASPELIESALRIVNYTTYRHLQSQGPNAVRKGKHGTAELVGDISHDPDLLALYYATALPHWMQKVMGADEVEPVRTVRVLSSYPCLDPSAESPALLGDRWTIEGFTKEGHHSPYNVLIGVALTDFTETDRGNFCVHPGSHMVLMEQYREHAAQKQTLFSEDPLTVRKPDLGEPLQLRLRAGDAFLCTQRLATLLALNRGSTVNHIAFFRASHVDHAVMKEPALDSMWVEFKHASLYLEHASEPTRGSEWEEIPTAVPMPDDFERPFVQKPSSAPAESQI